MTHRNKSNKQKNEKKRISKSSVLLIVMFITGLSLLIYPSFSNAWNQAHSTRLVASYDNAVKHLKEDDKKELLTAAEEYNQSLLSNPSRYQMTDEERKEYESLLNVGGNGIMGYISIPDIDVELPIYHGTDNAVLTIGAGHLEGSSLPVGGTGTHAVITGHRGLPRAKLFTDLPKISEGSIFQITVLNKTLTYEVDQILTVLPDEVESLEIDPQQDYVTLVTCTPYGINSHRLLVRGHRIDNPESVVSAEAGQIDKRIVAAYTCIPILLVVLVLLFIKGQRRHKAKQEWKHFEDDLDEE